MVIQTVDLVKAFINSHHGWAVADQFQDTFNGEGFEEQNHNDEGLFDKGRLKREL